MAQRGPITGPAVRNDPPDPDDWALVVRVIGGIIVIGPVLVDQIRPAISTVTTVAVAAVATTLLVANVARQGAAIYNDDNARLFVKLGVGATTGNFTVRLDGRGFYELSFPCYTGIITAIRAAGPAGSVQVTELT